MNDSGSHDPESEIRIATERGSIDALFHDVGPSTGPVRGAVLTVGGFDGGFDGPAHGIYADLADDLPPRGIALLRLDFRVKTSPGPIDEGTFDLLAGVDWLTERDRAPVLLVGHSYGGAVVVRAAIRSASVAGVAALSTQTAGIDEVAGLAPRSLLLVHGADDDRLPPRLSQWVYEQALEPKALHILPGATHSLRQQRDELWTILTNWIEATLPAAPR